ncbi:MAG: hypothetical protein ACFHVJ_19950 [Aestuariibacter sp.]
MKKLILHIGSHKTGTSAIQKALVENKRALKKNGWRLFHQMPNGKSYPKGSCSSWVDFEGSGEFFKASVNENLFDELGKLPGSHILSSEELSWLFDEDQISLFCQNLKSIYDQITVIVYLRRQDKQLVSHYQQGFKFTHSTARRFFGNEISPLPNYSERFDKYLDYFTRIGFWAKSVGESNLKVRIFEPEYLHNDGVVADFFSICDIPLCTVDERVNEAVCKFDVAVNEAREISNFSNQAITDFIKMCVLERNPELRLQKLVPSMSSAYHIYERFIKNNRLLNEQFKLVNRDDLFSTSDFELYPEEEIGLSQDEKLRLIGEFFGGLEALKVRDVLRLLIHMLRNRHRSSLKSSRNPYY